MAKLKHTVVELVDVIGPLRDFYTQAEDGKFHLDIEGDPPKLAEFRKNNIDLMKERDLLKAQADADKAKLAELLTNPEATKQTADLEAQLAAERSAHAATQLAHRGARLAHEVSTQFLKFGGRPNAMDHVVTEAAKVFAMDDAGALTTKEFSAANPAQTLTLTEWIEKQQKVADYLFLPSSGGGARGSATPARFGARSSQKVLKNPTPQQIGANASAIAKGDIKVEYS